MLDERNVRNIINGKRSKASGEFFEKLIDNSCRYYEQIGVAKIEKQQEPVHYIRPYGRAGQFIANYAKKSGVDYKGTINGGYAVCFEAKHTDANRIMQSRVQPHQEAYLKAQYALGALCFILVSFGLQDFYRIPFSTWQNMKLYYGRKYLTKADIEKYRVPTKCGILKFLPSDFEKELE